MTVTLPFLASIFAIEAGEYVHFTFDAGARATVRNVIIGFAIGILIAALYAFYQKNVPGAIVRALLREECLSQESAKTLTELKLDKNPLYAFELQHNTFLKRLIVTTENGEETGELRYFIPEELKYKAEFRYEKKGSGIVSLVLTLVAVVVVSVLLIRIIPSILGVVDHLMG